MRLTLRTLVITMLALAALAPLGCESTGPVSGCVRCRCECQGATGVQTTTFESKDSEGELMELSCTPKGDCVAECARIKAPTPVNATCLVAR